MKRKNINVYLLLSAVLVMLSLSLVACKFSPLPNELRGHVTKTMEVVGAEDNSSSATIYLDDNEFGQTSKDVESSDTENTNVEETTSSLTAEESTSESIVANNSANAGETETSLANQHEIDIMNGKIKHPAKDQPYTIKGIILVNKNYPITAKYVPEVTDDNRPVAVSIKKDLDDLINAAEEDGFNFEMISGYRSYDTQDSVLEDEISTWGKKEALATTAIPGTSEHQTGLAVDLIDLDNPDTNFKESLGDLDSGKWLAANAYKYGFIIRYLKGKDDITGYSYEPWHLRYVGKNVAKDFGANTNMTLEEYLGVIK